MHPLNNNDGAIAQLVEQRTENPCVTGSIPVGTTETERVTKVTLFSFRPFLGVFSLMFKPCLNQKLSMNPSISIIYYTSKTLKNGNHPLMLRIIQNRQTKYVSLGVNINPKFWDIKKMNQKGIAQTGRLYKGLSLKR